MSALVKKEIRLLLPAWIVAMMLAVLPAWINGLTWIVNFPLTLHDWTTLDILFAFGVIFLGIASFGQEISSGAFTILLSQPAERRRTWRVKTTILSIAFVSVWLAAVASIVCQFYIYVYLSRHGLPFRANGPAFNADVVGFLALAAFITFSGGLWTTLLLRQITIAFWVMLLAPMAIFMGAGLILDFVSVSDQFANVSLLIVLFIYSLAGFFYARKLFLNAQDVQWTGGEISFQWRRKNDQTRASLAPGRQRHWLAMLTWKEIQLHQVNLLIAVFLFVMNLSCFFVHKIHPHFKNPDVTCILEIVWIIWLVMPLLIGCTAIAEERKLGVFDSQKCLPVSCLTQFLVKFSIALILSVLLGGIIPSVFFERVGEVARIVFLIAAAIFFISFYASSLTRSTFQAIGLAAVVALVMFFYEGLESGWCAVPMPYTNGVQLFQEERDWFLSYQCFLTAPVLLLSLSGLAFWNYKCMRERREIWLMNIFIVLAALVFLIFLSILAPANFDFQRQ